MRDRRDFMRYMGVGLAATPVLAAPPTWAMQTAPPQTPAAPMPEGSIFDVRKFGAVGDGKAIDTPAVNKAIEAAAAAGGGTVLFPTGIYACYSIHLKTKVALHLSQGAIILAASTPIEGTTSDGYDAAEENPEAHDYQDFGHTHWHNSLIWGEGLHDISITGPGLIWGKGLSRGGRSDNLPRAEAPGAGNKAIALKNCRNVTMRDFSILQGGHFGILATGVDNWVCDGLKIDTNRDGIDFDCCKNVRVSNLTVNSPWDDGICPKSSYGLGYARATENVTITNCYVSGSYELGTMLDGSFKKFAPDARVPRTGRIKFGTESNGGFKNITVSNCVFDGCNGIALESVDGALLEDLAFTNITMRDISHAPLFLRLGSRMRGPAGVPVGTVKRIILSNIVSYNADSRLCAVLAGIPGHAIEDVKIHDIYLHHQGGGTAEMAALKIDEFENKYPEPTMFGPQLPANGFFIRHVKNLELSNVEIAAARPDARPAFVMEGVDGADFFRVKTPNAAGSIARMTNVANFRALACRGIKDGEVPRAEQTTL
jgi:polygalacturonase